MKKLLCMLVAVLMMLSMVACGSNNGEVETDAPTTDAPKKSVTVNIVIRASEKGEDVYVFENYEYTGSSITLIDILDEVMLVEGDAELVFNDEGTLVEVGTVKAEATQLWLFSKATAPKGADYAEPVDADIDEYNKIADGDTFVIYLS